VTLYFFSTGHRGFGGMDLFMSRRLDSTWKHWSPPVNLGPQVNTSGDEASISLTVRGDSAYIASIDPITRQASIYVVCLADSLRPLPPPPAAASVRELQLYFEFARWELPPQEQQRLREFLAQLPLQQVRRILVAGHTDDVGSHSYNLKLSQQRAQTVAELLVRSGIARERLTIHAYGKERPAVPGTTPEARRRNRRVEVRVELLPEASQLN
jgi:outer membrane protein OmpA-like peptidoglycan-associated protein